MHWARPQQPEELPDKNIGIHFSRDSSFTLHNLKQNAEEYKCSHRHWPNIARCWTPLHPEEVEQTPYQKFPCKRRVLHHSNWSTLSGNAVSSDTNYFFQLDTYISDRKPCQWKLSLHKLHEHRGQPLYSHVSNSLHLGSLYCKLKRMISCTLWPTHQSSNTSYFGHFIRALPSDIYSNIILWFTVALSRKYQHRFSLNFMLNLTQVNCYCW